MASDGKYLPLCDDPPLPLPTREWRGRRPPHFDEIVAAISRDHPLLRKYVHRDFDDIKQHLQHLQSLRKAMTPRGRCFYLVGNSKFYDTLLPVEEIYAALFEDAGFTDVGWKAIRKRNSKKELFEYVVHAVTPK